MNTGCSRLSPAEAHEELALMDSRVAGMPVESFFDRLRRMDLPYAGVLERFRDLLTETRWYGGRVIHLGKIMGNEILEFMESDPDQPSGVMLASALLGLGQMAPFLGPVLAPLSAEVESQGFSKLLGQSGFGEKMGRRAMAFFRRSADIFNLTKNLVKEDRSSMRLDAVFFEEPTLFEWETSENPFDLDDLHTLSPTSMAVVKYLVKISLSDGRLSDKEKLLISQTLERMGEYLSESQFERLAAEASQESTETILQDVLTQPVEFKERLLLLAMLVTAADGRVDPIEKKLLAQAASLLGISRGRYAEIGSDAVSLIKTRKDSLAECGQLLAPSFPRVTSSVPAMDQPRAMESIARVPPHQRDQSARGEHPAQTTRQEPREEPRTHAGSDAPRPRGAERPLPAASPVGQRIWRCPACNMPQFQDFDECPQCGIIVAKFREKYGLRRDDQGPDGMAPLLSDAVEKTSEEVAPQSRGPSEPGASRCCTSCGATPPAAAKFCPSCGARVG